MGWKLIIKTDRPISKSDVIKSLQSLGRGIWKRPQEPPVEVPWGWRGYLCDVYFPSQNEVMIGGAWGNFNGHNFARTLSKKLRSLGYITRIGKETE